MALTQEMKNVLPDNALEEYNDLMEDLAKDFCDRDLDYEIAPFIGEIQEFIESITDAEGIPEMPGTFLMMDAEKLFEMLLIVFSFQDLFQYALESEVFPQAIESQTQAFNYYMNFKKRRKKRNAIS